MGIQSDIEMLSIRALEEYAKMHHISETEAVQLFYKYQVFEKILMQHEYLHQLDFSETINYVEDLQIRDVVDIIQKTTGMNFPDAMVAFYHSRTYKALQNTENTLWAESAGYIADRYFEENE